MTIETFTKEEFESYLENYHSPYKPLGLVDGEYAYRLPLDGQSAIMLRSSIKGNGVSASTGKDSIRAWLVDSSDKPLGSKVSKWTNRLPGWESRLTDVIKTICEWRAATGDCPDCDKPKSVFKSKTASNKGRIFAKCREHNHFVWLDEIDKENNNVYFSKASYNGNIGNVGEVAYQESSGESDSMRLADTDNGNTGNGESARETSESGEVPAVPQSSEPEAKIAREPNPEQRQAIEAPIDANVRVLAPPGSGKTFVIEHRYNYLVQNGVNPNKILVVTFSKQMADEMGQRIQTTCPVANLEQISTIHALCYRLLAKWDVSSPYFKWEVLKDENWRVRKEIEDLIGQIWSYGEKPGYKEVLEYINTTKYLGLTVDESYEWFCGVLGNQYGEWLYEVRSRFDAWLQRNRSLTFADMLYLTEQKLKKDKAWREELQRKFEFVICDEAQDTAFNAMRILITISLESGQNTIYESEAR